MMTDILNFMGEHQMLTGFLSLMLTITIVVIIETLVNLPNRIMRHWNIKKEKEEE